MDGWFLLEMETVEMVVARKDAGRSVEQECEAVEAKMSSLCEIQKGRSGSV